MVCGKCQGSKCKNCDGSTVVPAGVTDEVVSVVMIEINGAQEKVKMTRCLPCGGRGAVADHASCIAEHGESSTHCDCQHRKNVAQPVLLHAS